MSKTIHNYSNTTDYSGSEIIKFELHNNDKHKISFMNAIRRICIGEININAIDTSTIKIFKNTSCINESMLRTRLEQSPIYKKTIYDNLKLVLNISNEESGIRSIYLSDFKILNKHSNKDEEQYNISDIFVYPRILYAKIKHGETINLEGEFTSNNVNGGTSSFSPVCPITYHFKQDDTKVATALKDIDGEFNQNDFKLRDADRCYKMNSKNEPTICVMTIESCGNMSSNQIFNEALDVFRDKLDTFIKNIKSYENHDMIDIKSADYNIESFDYSIRDEDTTLGNLLQDYLFEHSKVAFVGYDVPHPLDPILLIRMGLKKNNTIDENNNVMSEIVTMLVGYIDDLQKEWESVDI